MAIPGFYEIAKPFLRLAAEGREWSLSDIREVLARYFRLTPEERSKLYFGGPETRFGSNVSLVESRFREWGLLASERPGYFKITDLGIAAYAHGLASSKRKGDKDNLHSRSPD